MGIHLLLSPLISLSEGRAPRGFAQSLLWLVSWESCSNPNALPRLHNRGAPTNMERGREERSEVGKKPH